MRDQNQQASDSRKVVKRAEDPQVSYLFEKFQTAESHVEILGKFVKQKTAVEKLFEKKEKPLKEVQEHGMRNVKQAEKDVKQLMVSFELI